MIFVLMSNVYAIYLNIGLWIPLVKYPFKLILGALFIGTKVQFFVNELSPFLLRQILPWATWFVACLDEGTPNDLVPLANHSTSRMNSKPPQNWM
jgi:hypothetical protein